MAEKPKWIAALFSNYNFLLRLLDGKLLSFPLTEKRSTSLSDQKSGASLSTLLSTQRGLQQKFFCFLSYWQWRQCSKAASWCNSFWDVWVQSLDLTWGPPLYIYKSQVLLTETTVHLGSSQLRGMYSQCWWHWTSSHLCSTKTNPTTSGQVKKVATMGENGKRSSIAVAWATEVSPKFSSLANSAYDSSGLSVNLTRILFLKSTVSATILARRKLSLRKLVGFWSENNGS